MMEFHGGRVHVHSGDCREVLAGFDPDSFDAVVCDPPYGLKFMNRHWDYDIPSVDTWRAVFRVLKPGGHMVAFSGTRTYHRMTCAIEDAGFEVRDVIMWHYGSGFCKSHNLRHQPICRCADDNSPSEHDVQSLPEADLSNTGSNGEEQADILLSCLSKQNLSSQGTARAESETCGGEQPGMVRRIVHRAGQGIQDDSEAGPSKSASKRVCAGAHINSRGDVGQTAVTKRRSAPQEPQQGGQHPGKLADIRQSSGTLDDRALPGRGACPRCGKLKKEFEGFGSALKPATEIICLARKPLSESTISGNVLKHGTGAINVDGCRVATEDTLSIGAGKLGYESGLSGINPGSQSPLGRWPANLCHDNSPEVLEGFPESDAGSASGYNWDESKNDNPTHIAKNIKSGMHFGDSGSAARFFASFPRPEADQKRFHYTSKADADDRLGSRHPTVKPVSLICWLARLITPPKGRILDCFAGTGTTAEAALREGFSCTLVEREAEYIRDIERRMALVFEGETGRSVAMAKLKPEGEPLPLFPGDAA